MYSVSLRARAWLPHTPIPTSSQTHLTHAQVRRGKLLFIRAGTSGYQAAADAKNRTQCIIRVRTAGVVVIYTLLGSL